MKQRHRSLLEKSGGWALHNPRLHNFTTAQLQELHTAQLHSCALHNPRLHSSTTAVHTAHLMSFTLQDCILCTILDCTTAYCALHTPRLHNCVNCILCTILDCKTAYCALQVHTPRLHNCAPLHELHTPQLHTTHHTILLKLHTA